MKTCPYCAEEIQDAALVCKHCGRDLRTGLTGTPAATAPPRVVVKPKEGLFLQGMNLGCLVVLVLALLFTAFCTYVCYQVPARTPQRSPAATTASPSSATSPVTRGPSPRAGAARTPKPSPSSTADDDMKRLVLENHRWDDSARNFVLQQVLSGNGMRCDSIRSATMSARGAWRVTCDPGYGYVVRFNAKGEPVSAQSLQ